MLNWGMSGHVRSIYIAPEAGAPVRRVERVRAVAGRGLEGDRYWAGVGSFSRWPGPVREVTLIAQEALDEAAGAFGVAVGEGEHRRNLVTEGIDLGSLLKQRFSVGPVQMEGLRICAPCKYLIRVTGQDRIFDALVRRGGLRARVLSSGEIREGDTVVPLAPEAERFALP
ncbi:MOSC domain-containing protein [Rubricoccus marinus]|nr:MOSC domain-containing protein [Rubricoccus marinus]